MIKAKGYNPEYIGDKLKASLRRKIDDFWMKQMEAKYIQERVKESQEAMTKSIWKTAQSEIDLLMQLVLELGTIHAGLFITSKDLPEWWWVVKNEYWDGKPRKNKYGEAWSQRFEISDGKGYEQDDYGSYFRMVDQEKIYDLTYQDVLVEVHPRFWGGGDKGELFDWGKLSIQSYIDDNGFQPIGKLGVACIKITEYCELSFYRGMYACDVRIGRRLGIDRADMPKYEKLLRYFSNIIFRKMSPIVIENPK